MSTEESAPKRQRTDEKYQLFYWPGIPGRGEPIRLAFEEAGVDYEDVASTKGVSTVTKLLAEKAAHFAPPMLRHGDLEISQLPNIMFYIGGKLKLLPDGDEKWRVNQLFLTAMDCQNETHDTHHPIAPMLYYDDQKEEALRKAKDFRETRIPKYFGHFEAALAANKEKNGELWLVGADITYADLGLFHLVDGLLFAFPKATARVLESHPNVAELHKRVKDRPRVAEYLKSDRRQAFSNGIYRKYAELDDPEEESTSDGKEGKGKAKK